MMVSIVSWVIAGARVVEARARGSRHLVRFGRNVLALLARRSNEARAFVRLRVMRMI